ncbi:MAG: hypothetical protein PHD70_07195 [Anaerostipes sp.]|nr:hypothetical protein [Anaerostipes sp.]
MSEVFEGIILVGDEEINVPKSSKEKILFYPGGLKNNGLTNSFLNLLYHLDYDRYDYYIILD